MKVVDWITVWVMAAVILLAIAIASAESAVLWTGDAEPCDVGDWSTGGVAYGGVTATTGSKKNGTCGYNVEVTDPAVDHDEGKTFKWTLPNGNHLDVGYYYKGWYKIKVDAVGPPYVHYMQWKEWKQGAPPCGVVMTIDVVDRGRGRELELTHFSCTTGGEPCIDFPGDLAGTPTGVYRAATATIVPFDTWFTLEAYFQPKAIWGEITVWLNGAQIFSYTADNFNLLNSECDDNTAVYWGSGLYPAPTSGGLQKIWMDDLKICDAACP